VRGCAFISCHHAHERASCAQLRPAADAASCARPVSAPCWFASLRGLPTLIRVHPLWTGDRVATAADLPPAFTAGFLSTGPSTASSADVKLS
jgi:hypothetical protein